MSNGSSSYLTSPSLVSVATTSSASSSTPLRRPASSTKDYSAAFGQLQSQYGWGGPAPVQPPMRIAPQPKKKEQRKEKRSTNMNAGTPTASEGKDFQAAYGALSSRFGFGGSSPMPKSSTPSKTKDERR
ncbi:hypothetical protein C2E23DRAFT_890154 [Lenzites betulinus]|nr:hypothetical protein C2E23DRAFT_890154 [Lenzites betulinus]